MDNPWNDEDGTPTQATRGADDSTLNPPPTGPVGEDRPQRDGLAARLGQKSEGVERLQVGLVKLGATFARLTVVGFIRKERGRHGAATFVRAKCECGNSVEALPSDIRSGKVKSCGCYQRDITAERNRTHGLAGTPTHKIWVSMRERCNNPTCRDFALYGGRGIKVCERWNSFENFLADMGERPVGMSIERRDANGNYELENCTWATAKQQARNTRRNRWVLVDGREMIVSEAKRILRHSYRTLMLRIARGEIQEIVKYHRPAGTLRHR